MSIYDKPLTPGNDDKEFAEWVGAELGSDLDLSDRVMTIERLQEMGDPLMECLNGYQELDADVIEKEEVQEVTDSYVSVIESILPEGVSFQQVTLPAEALWRGTTPIDLISLMSEEGAGLDLKSTFPNVAHNWTTSLSYGRSKEANSKMPFVLAIGFSKPKKWKVEKQEVNDVYKDTIDTVQGRIRYEDIKFIAIRLKGKAKGKVYPPQFYKLKREGKLAA
jgi:hypothetical protein